MPAPGSILLFPLSKPGRTSFPGIFQENIVNQVLEDVVKACDPVWAVVKGVFRPRGGIGTTVEARWPRPAA